MKIRVLRDGKEMARYELGEGEYLVGSGDSAHLRLDDAGIAPKHARIKIGTGGVKIEDLGSGFTTRLGELAVAGVQPVPAGANLQLGSLVIEFLDDAAATPVQPQKDDARENSREAPERYVIGDVVAKGAMGVIRRARELNTGREVAMKQMHDSLESGDAALAARFVQEAKITAHLEHPNVVPVHDVSPGADGRRFYTMKMVRGISLEKVIDLLHSRTDGGLKKYPLAALLTIFQKACDALAFAHSKGVIHRDLKPANIMVGAYGEVLVMDWGLAKTLNEEGRMTNDEPAGAPSLDIGESDFNGTLAGSVMGTPFYMAPEQAMGDVAHVDARSDIYALGAILSELLTLLPPIEGKSTHEVLARVREGKITPPQQRIGTVLLPHLPGGKIPPSLAAVVAKAMSFSPERRYQRVEDLQEEILAYQGGRATSAEDAGAWRQFTLLVKRNKGVSTALAASFAILAALSVIYTAAVIRERNRANSERAQAGIERDRATNALAAAEDERKRATDALRVAEEEKMRADTEREKATTALRSEEQEKKRADTERSRAETESASAKTERDRATGTLQQLRGTAPTFLAQADALIQNQKVAEAMEKLDFAVAVDPKNADAILRRAHLRQAALQLREAAEDYRRVLALRKDKSATTNLALCERLIGANPDLAKLSQLELGRLQYDMTQEQRMADSAIVGLRMTNNNERLQSLLAVRLKAWMGMRGWGKGSSAHIGHGTIRIILRDIPISDLSPLVGLPINSLRIHNIPAADLRPLAGLPLEQLLLEGQSISDIRPLQGLKLRELELIRTSVKDLSPLSGMPLGYLSVEGMVKDLSPLRGAPLHSLKLKCPDVSDLTPLRGIPLKSFSDTGSKIVDISPIDNPKLESLIIEGGWNKEGALESIDGLTTAPLTTLHVIRSRVRSIQAMKGKPLKSVVLTESKIEDLSFLEGCNALQELTLPGSPRAPWAMSLYKLRGLPRLNRIGDSGPTKAPGAFFHDLERNYPPP